LGSLRAGFWFWSTVLRVHLTEVDNAISKGVPHILKCHPSPQQEQVATFRRDKRATLGPYIAVFGGPSVYNTANNSTKYPNFITVLYSLHC